MHIALPAYLYQIYVFLPFTFYHFECEIWNVLFKGQFLGYVPYHRHMHTSRTGQGSNSFLYFSEIESKYGRLWPELLEPGDLVLPFDSSPESAESPLLSSSQSIPFSSQFFLFTKPSYTETLH